MPVLALKVPNFILNLIQTLNMLEKKSYEIYTLAIKLKDAIRDDWKAQQARSLRPEKYSVRYFDEILYKQRPEIRTTGYLKKVMNYQGAEKRDGSKPEMTLYRIEIVVDFLFNDLANDYGWPLVIDVFRNEQGGRFMPIVRKHLSDVAFKDVRAVLKSADLVKAGASKDSDFYEQIIQLAIRAKGQAEYNSIKMRSLEEENQRLKEETAIVELLEKELKQEIEAIEKLMESKDIDQNLYEGRLNQLKQLLEKS